MGPARRIGGTPPFWHMGRFFPLRGLRRGEEAGPSPEGALREGVTHAAQAGPGLSQLLRWEKKAGERAWGPRRVAPGPRT